MKVSSFKSAPSWRPLFISASVLAILASSNAGAQQAAGESDMLEEIVVTARQRSENLQDTPFSMVAVTGDKLQAQNVVSTMDLDNKVPGLVLRADNTRPQPFIGIRGVGDISRNPGIDNRTGMYLDGAPLGRSSSINYPIFDIESVEVLRGPQGTLFGNNSLTGVIAIQSQKPSFQDSSRTTVSTGERNLFAGSGYVNKAVTDDLAVRLTAAGRSQDGYYKNAYDGSTAGGGTNYAGRVQVRYVPTPDTTIDFSADGVRAKDEILLGVGKFSTGPMAGMADYTFNANTKPFRDRTIWGLGLNVEQTLPEDFVLTSISSYRRSRDSFNYDGDGSPASLINVGFRYADWALSQELRIASPKNPLYDYVVGAFYYHQNPSEVQTVRFGPDYPVVPVRGSIIGGTGVVATDQAALFAHGTLRPTEWLALDAGLRYQRTTKSADKVQDNTAILLGYPPLKAHFGLSDPTLNPMASVTVKPTSDISIYALYSTGDRAGGFNMDVVKTLSGVTFDAESVVNYEAGVKTELFGRRLRLNLAAYRQRFKDFQQAQNIIDPNPAAGTLPTVINVITNAARVRSQGIEADFDASLLPGLRLSGGVGFNHAYFRSFPDGGGPGVDYTGSPLVEAPRFQGSLALDYRHQMTEDFDGRISLTATNRSKVYSQPGSTVAPFNDGRYLQDGYTSVGMRLALERRDEGLELALWVRNLTDERHADGASPVAAGYLFKGLNEPRTIGVDLTLRL
ncbi:TonB-dependent receptor [Niveispirillum sp.]|uniref:TonB-dependent receptor n=1 Tax=Niveispirillum sp. TaxID=1917217 RepID=UPI001B49C242|nr:TonB-dependent receptor [Niveispirillum sp.]MBP7334292.1 TonB-dependent receptor [Niveispirillum sp.]